MAQFRYKAYAADDVKRRQEDVIEAQNIADVQAQLRRLGFIPVSIEEVVEKKVDFNRLNSIFDKVKTQDLAQFTRQLATMFNAGMSSLRSLEVAGRNASNKTLQRAAAEVGEDINSGASMSVAFSQHEKIFNPLYISLVKAGEMGGVMPDALNRLADQMEKDAQLKREIRGALMYPSVVMCFAFVVVIVMLLFVVPAFQAIFESAGGTLPAPTRLLVSASNLVKEFWFVIPAIPFGVVYGSKAFLKSESGRRAWDQFKLKAPSGIGKLNQKIVTARFTRTLSTLMGAGVPILSALEIAGPTSNNVIISRAVDRAGEEIKSGSTISDALGKQKVFPDMATSMLIAGEESGEINHMLDIVAQEYEDQVAATIKSLKSIMEPILMMAIGGVIGMIVVCLYLPIFKIYDQIK